MSKSLRDLVLIESDGPSWYIKKSSNVNKETHVQMSLGLSVPLVEEVAMWLSTVGGRLG